MRRWSLILLVGVAGCTANRAPVETVETVDRPVRYAPSASAALVLPVPTTIGQELPDLSRDARRADAFVAYDQPTITRFYLRIDDRQSQESYGRFGNFDRHTRRAVTTRYGVVVR